MNYTFHIYVTTPSRLTREPNRYCITARACGFSSAENEHYIRISRRRVTPSLEISFGRRRVPADAACVQSLPTRLTRQKPERTHKSSRPLWRYGVTGDNIRETTLGVSEFFFSGPPVRRPAYTYSGGRGGGCGTYRPETEINQKRSEPICHKRSLVSTGRATCTPTDLRALLFIDCHKDVWARTAVYSLVLCLFRVRALEIGFRPRGERTASNSVR